MNTDIPCEGVCYEIVPDFPDYRVGDDGSVWKRVAVKSEPGVFGWKKLKPYVVCPPYLGIRLSANGRTKYFALARLVLQVFDGPCPKGLAARFRNGNPADNRADNLFWGEQPTVSPEIRFWTRVDKNGPLWNGTPCWVWTGGKTPANYGTFSLGRKRDGAMSTHKFAYILLRGEVSKDLTLDHLCRNTLCCNPDHLEPVTSRTNLLRGIGAKIVAHHANTCIKGHELTAENTMIRSGRNGTKRRCCRICVRASDKRRRLERKRRELS